MTITGPRCIKARVASNRMSLSVYNSYETRLGKRPVMGGSVDRTPPPRDHLPACLLRTQLTHTLGHSRRASRKHSARTMALDQTGQTHDVSAKQARSHHIHPTHGAETIVSCFHEEAILIVWFAFGSHQSSRLSRLLPIHQTIDCNVPCWVLRVDLTLRGRAHLNWAGTMLCALVLCHHGRWELTSCHV